MTMLTIVATVRATPLVVYRMLSVCRRYRAQLESVTVARTNDASIAKMTLIVYSAPATPLLAQLRKLVDVLEVHVADEQSESSFANQPPLSPVSDVNSPSPLPRHSAQADGAF